MTNTSDTSEPGEESGDRRAPGGSPRPKRGAFPTPQSELDKAKPYVPHFDQADDRPKTEPATSTDVDGEEKEDPAV